MKSSLPLLLFGIASGLSAQTEATARTDTLNLGEAAATAYHPLLAQVALPQVTSTPDTPDRKPVRISGTLLDSLSRQPEAFATLRIRRSGRKEVVKALATDAEGRFSVTVDSGRSYEFEFVSIGKAPLRLTLAPSTATELGTLLMHEAGQTLGTATVTAQRPLVKAEVDKLTYAMADDPESRSSTLLEMLRKVPMVTVDGEDNIKVKGSASFQVHVNGKPDKMMTANPSLIFKTYPASTIKRIEVITRPGAKYDAEGVAGILNIITETETRTTGYNFSPSLQWSDRGYGIGAFGTTQLDKLTFSLNFGAGHNDHGNIWNSSERETFDDPQNHLLTTSTLGNGNGTYTYGTLEASYDFTAKDLLSLSVGLWGYNGETTSSGETIMQNADREQAYKYNSSGTQEQKMLNINVSLDYQHTFKEAETFTFSYRLGTSPNRNTSRFAYFGLTDVPDALRLTDLYQRPNLKSHEHTWQADYTRTFASKHTFSAGAKYIYRLNRSDNSEFMRPAGSDAGFEFDPERSLHYRHRSGVAAAYAEYKLALGKFSLQAGLRDELFKARVDYPDGKRPAFSRTINDLVPSVNLGYSLGPAQMVSAGYALRIARPGIDQLSPYVEREGAETVSYGNPALESETSHNLEANFSRFSTKFSINAGLSYSLSTNGLMSHSFVKDGVLHTTQANHLHRKELALSLFLNWTVASGTNLNLNANGSYADYRSYRTADRNHGFSASAWFGATQQLPWKLKASLWMGGNTKQPGLQENAGAFFFHNLSLTRDFLKDDRLNVTLYASSPFRPRYTIEHEQRSSTFRSTTSARINIFRYGISFRYRLGTLKATVKKVARTINNTDVAKPANSEAGAAGQTGGR